jgi:hypothetical protein
VSAASVEVLESDDSRRAALQRATAAAAAEKDLLLAAEAREAARRDLMRPPAGRFKSFVAVRARHPREEDAENMMKVKNNFK